MAADGALMSSPPPAIEISRNSFRLWRKRKGNERTSQGCDLPSDLCYKCAGA